MYAETLPERSLCFKKSSFFHSEMNLYRQTSTTHTLSEQSDDEPETDNALKRWTVNMLATHREAQ